MSKKTFIWPATPLDTTGLATEAKQDVQIVEAIAANASLDAIEQVLDDAATGAVPLSVTGPLTDAQLRAAPVPVSAASLPLPTGAATEATLAAVQAQTTRLAPVDQLDNPLLSVAVTNIPASSSLPVEVVSSLAAASKKIISVEDIGEFIGLYTGAASAEVLHCVLPLGGGEVEVNLPAATRISLRHMKNTVISSDFIAINFLG